MKYVRLRKLIDSGSRKNASLRLNLLFYVFAAFMIAVIATVARLTFSRHNSLLSQAVQNTFCSIPLPAVRGDIIDRRGVTLAVDNSAFRIISTGRNCSWKEEEYISVSGLPGESTSTAGLPRAGDFTRISNMVEMPEDTPGRFVDIVPRRTYPFGEHTAHIIGYLGQISPDEMKRLRHAEYRDGDRIGKSGLEKWYETEINGKRGRREIMTGASGDMMSRGDIHWSKKGRTLELSLDIELQKAATAAFSKRSMRGAAVFMDSQNGEILALVSSPGFFPAPGADGMTPAGWGGYVRDPAKPLLNRAVSSSLPLGSVFKLVVAAAALEDKSASRNSSFVCRGAYPIPGRLSNPPKCYTTHGSINFIHGIAQSCDVVFYSLGQKLGVGKIAKYAAMFGLGGKSGIDLPGEYVGLVPDEYWKKHFGGGGKWTAGDTINLSIGQGNMQVTPVQVARMVNVFASGGKLVTPHLARGGNWTAATLPLKASTLEAVRAGMRGAVLEGTCRGMLEFPVPTAAKTGTAQTGTRDNPGKSHSWFAGFAPYDKPVITFAVYVEHGGYGAEAALPIAREILSKALELEYFPGYSYELPKARASSR